MYCFARICRLCLSHDSVLVHCRTRDKNNVPNYHKIKVLFPHLVSKTSQHFPVWICTKCQEQVSQFYEFKQKCYKTYKLLREYSIQLYKANKWNNIPDVPTEVFQEVKPIVDKNVIAIDDDEYSNNYYNADDITIVKNELLPNNLKNEPEYHEMIQAIIDNNIETVREIDGAGNSSADLKRDLLDNSDANSSHNQRLLPEIEEVASTVSLESNHEAVEQNNLITSSTNEITESNPTINSLDATAFTLDYTNASFETFASHIAPNITVAGESVAKSYLNNNEENVTQNVLNSSTRVLRRRKSICYRTLEKCLDILDDQHTENAKKRSLSPSKITNKSKSPVRQTSQKKDKTKKNGTIELITKTPEKPLKKNNIRTPKASVTRSSDLTVYVLKENNKQKGAYFCDKCSKQYVRSQMFYLHTSKCNGIIRHQCTVCHKYFANMGNLNRHRKLHVLLKMKLVCDLCHNLYANEKSLNKHIRLKHNLNMNKSNPFF